jgi:hypothetical protein
MYYTVDHIRTKRAAALVMAVVLAILVLVAAIVTGMTDAFSSPGLVELTDKVGRVDFS